MVISKFKRLCSKNETVSDVPDARADEGNTSTAVVEYEQPSLMSSRKRRQSSDYQRPREYRGSNLSSGSRRLISGSQNTTADTIIDAEYEEVTDAEYAKSINEGMKSAYGDIPSAKSSTKRLSSKSLTKSSSSSSSSSKRLSSKSLTKSSSSSSSSSKRPSEGFSTQKSPKKRVVDAKAPESDFSLDEQRRIWSRYGKTEDEMYQKAKAAREDAEYSIGMKKAKLRGQQRGINLDDVEEIAYQAETNRRDVEKLKKDVEKAKEKGINRATPLKEKIAQQGKAVGKAIVQGFEEFDKTIEAFGKSHMGNNIAKTNEATLKGMQEAGERARGSITGSKANITRSALNKPRTFGTWTTTAPIPKITTRIVRRGKNNVVLYFDEYGRQISAAAARAYLGGKVPAQKPVQIPAQNVNQHTVAPFAVGKPENPLGDLWNHGIPFAAGHYTPPFAPGNHQAPFIAGVYQVPFVLGSKPTLVVSGYGGNPIGDIRKSGNPLGNIRWISGNPLGAIRREGNPLGTIRREGNPLGEMIKFGNPLGDDERRGHTSRILRWQVKKEGNPVAGSEKAGHMSRIVRGQTKKSENSVART